MPGPALVAVLACDLPAVAPAEIRLLVDVLALNDDIACAVSLPVEHPQWLHAVWRRTAADHLAERFSEGERSVHRGVAGLSMMYRRPIDPAALADVDRPEDLARYAQDDPQVAGG
jgi:molybdopterin-guanine dinucleotide biosynthesis protein A